MPKEKCKYWDKCYQKNLAHKQKYMHPEECNINHNETLSDKEVMTKVQDGMNASSENIHNENATSAEEYDTKDLREEVLANIQGKDYMSILQKRIRLSEQKEYENLVKSIDFIHHKFLVEMPLDFFEFWQFLQQQMLKQNNDDGLNLLLKIESDYQLQLVGPFEFLAGKFQKAKIHSPGDYLRHWRFYYDPPEFQTVFVRKGTGIHYGYWRDTPQDKTRLLIARNDSLKNCEFQFIASNMFEAFHYYLENDYKSTPFMAGVMAKIKKSLMPFIEENNRSSGGFEKLLKERNKKVVCKTFHRAGIVVPYDCKTSVGYRPLIQSDAELKKIIKLLGKNDAFGDDVTRSREDSLQIAVKEKLQPIVTAANIAMDECDFGTALELGIDLFCSGRKELHSLIKTLLIQAYTVLKRPQFIAIIKSHLEKRSQSTDLSIFNDQLHQSK